MLKSIFIVTMIVRQLSLVEPAYTSDLQYQAVERGAIGAELATVWNAPAMQGDRYVLMRPASGAAVYLRFIEDATATEAPRSLTTHGWGAAELLVTDPDELARRLNGSSFKVIGAPRDLYPSEQAPRAMQAEGPAGEILYMTRPIPGGSRYDLGVAKTFVDRTFIVVVGGPSMTELRRFYSEVLGLAAGEANPFVIGVLSRANGLAPDTKYPLAVVPLSPGHLIELDEYPPGTGPRPRVEGRLPPRMAMVSFLAELPAQTRLEWRSLPRRLDTAPYNGRKTGVTVGPAGEWIEIVENTPR
jgi:hypothetical protein